MGGFGYFYEMTKLFQGKNYLHFWMAIMPWIHVQYCRWLLIVRFQIIIVLWRLQLYGRIDKNMFGISTSLFLCFSLLPLPHPLSFSPVFSLVLPISLLSSSPPSLPFSTSESRLKSRPNLMMPQPIHVFLWTYNQTDSRTVCNLYTLISLLIYFN